MRLWATDAKWDSSLFVSVGHVIGSEIVLKAFGIGRPLLNSDMYSLILPCFAIVMRSPFDPRHQACHV